MSRRFHTSGQSRSHVVHSGYRYESAQHARLETDDELSIRTLVKVALFSIAFVAFLALACAAVGGH